MSRYYGTAGIMGHVQQVLWDSRYYGTAGIMGQQVLWDSRYYGTAGIMGQQVLWVYCHNFLVILTLVYVTEYTVKIYGL